MRSSRTSSTGRDSKYLTVTKARIETAITSASTSQYLGLTTFRSTNILGRPANPRDNENVVHMLHAVQYVADVRRDPTSVCSYRAVAQLLRRPDDRFLAAVTAIQHIEDNPDLIAHESIWGSGDPFGASVANPVINDMYPLYLPMKYPIPILRPLTLACFFTLLQSAATATTINIFAYLYYQSVRIKGEEYRRLLDGFTQMSGNPRGTQA